MFSTSWRFGVDILQIYTYLVSFFSPPLGRSGLFIQSFAPGVIVSDVYGTIKLGSDKFEAFKLFASRKSSSGAATQAPGSENVTEEYTRVVIQGNTAGDNMNTFTGNIGFESGYRSSYMGTSKFVDNKLGNDGTLFTGDIGGQARCGND